VLAWTSVLLAVGVALGQHQRVAAAVAVGAVLLVGSVRVGFPWAAVLAVAASVVADLFVVRYGRLGWDPRVDAYVVGAAFAVAALGMLLAWLLVVPRAAMAARRAGRWVLRQHRPDLADADADGQPSPRPFTDDERLWELELTRQ
jgi:hypothetical protein